MIETRSVVRKAVDSLLDLAATVEKLDGLIPESVSFSADIGSGINIWPSSHDESRKILGALIRQFGSKPEIKKWGALELEAIFQVSGVLVRVNKYRGRKCAVVKREIVHAAEPEKIIPAKEAYVQEVEELVCELDDVENEVTPKEPETAGAL